MISMSVWIVEPVPLASWTECLGRPPATITSSRRAMADRDTGNTTEPPWCVMAFPRDRTDGGSLHDSQSWINAVLNIVTTTPVAKFDLSLLLVQIMLVESRSADGVS